MIHRDTADTLDENYNVWDEKYTGFNSRLNDTEETINELEDTAMATFQVKHTENKNKIKKWAEHQWASGESLRG